MDGEKIIRGRESGAARPRTSTTSSRTSSAEGTSRQRDSELTPHGRTIAVLALNLHNLMKRRLLPEEYGKSRPKSLRFLPLHHGWENSDARETDCSEDLDRRLGGPSSPLS